LRSIEARLLEQALFQSAGDRSGAAELLGISFWQLRYLLHKHAPLADKNWRA
jgi:DNA-binding protein Fis